MKNARPTAGRSRRRILVASRSSSDVLLQRYKNSPPHKFWALWLENKSEQYIMNRPGRVPIAFVGSCSLLASAERCSRSIERGWAEPLPLRQHLLPSAMDEGRRGSIVASDALQLRIAGHIIGVGSG